MSTDFFFFSGLCVGACILMQDPAIGKVFFFFFFNKYGAALVVKNTPAKAVRQKRTQIQSLGHEDP